MAAIFAFGILVLFAFVYLQTAGYMTARIDGIMTREAAVLSADPPGRRIEAMQERLRQDARRVRVAGLFRPDGSIVAGNLEALPSDLVVDGSVADARVVRVDGQDRTVQTVRAVARALSNGETLVVGRNIDEVKEFREIVGRALALGLIPAFCFSLAIGFLLTLRVQRRVDEVNRRVQRIVQGDLSQRLPVPGVADPFDKLAAVVNGMLEKIETLVHEIAGVGDDIAHDLRTPLTRVRVRLERGLDGAKTLEELRTVVSQALAGLDQSLAIVTALLRVAEIEHGKRRVGFAVVDLATLLRELYDIYEPIAEDRSIRFHVSTEGRATVHGDRDLLFEAIANLVDNALKFTPQGGEVELALLRKSGAPVIRVKDSGPGIRADERELVMKRFYRSDKSRHTPGLGLGLSLVAAIVKLHGFRLSIASGPGAVVEVDCAPAEN